MATISSTQARIEKVLLEAASLLVERARTQVEREIASDSAPDASHEADLERLRVLEDELSAIRQEFARPAGAAAIGPQLSRYYDVPGQEDS